MSNYANHLFDEGSQNNSWANMLNFIPRGSKVLDVGCSTGNFGAALEQLHDCTVVGVDVNADDIAEARTKISDAHVFDITDVGAVETIGAFDVIVFADVLEHLLDPRKVLRAAKALLSEGGIVVYSIPHMGHLSVRLNIIEGRFPYTEVGLLDRTHLHYYDRDEVDDLFYSSGFSIVEENPTFVGYPDQWLSSRLSALGLTDSPQFHAILQATEANVYQFVGRAIPSTDIPPVPPKILNDPGSPDDLLRRANALIDENDRLNGEIDRLAREADALHRALVEIKRSPLKVVVRSLRRRTTGT